MGGPAISRSSTKRTLGCISCVNAMADYGDSPYFDRGIDQDNLSVSDFSVVGDNSRPGSLAGSIDDERLSDFPLDECDEFGDHERSNLESEPEVSSGGRDLRGNTSAASSSVEKPVASKPWKQMVSHSFMTNNNLADSLVAPWEQGVFAEIFLEILQTFLACLRLILCSKEQCRNQHHYPRLAGTLFLQPCVLKSLLVLIFYQQFEA